VLKDAIIGTNGYRDYFNVENEKLKGIKSKGGSKKAKKPKFGK
jgi:hypothetical protein